MSLKLFRIQTRVFAGRRKVERLVVVTVRAPIQLFPCALGHEGSLDVKRIRRVRERDIDRDFLSAVTRAKKQPSRMSHGSQAAGCRHGTVKQKNRPLRGSP